MVFKNLYVLVLRTKVASGLEGSSQKDIIKIVDEFSAATSINKYFKDSFYTLFTV